MFHIEMSEELGQIRPFFKQLDILPKSRNWKRKPKCLAELMTIRIIERGFR